MQLIKRGGAITFGMFLALTITSPITAIGASGPAVAPALVKAPAPVTKKTDSPKWSISIGTEILDGDTTYQIGYPITMNGQTYEGYFPFSELKWPLDVVLARFAASASFSGNWKINTSLKKNVTDPGDNMEDSDWITDSNPSRLDIFSTSEISDFNATIFDFDVEYTFVQNPKFAFYGGLGYQYQKFDYDAQLIRQYSPSGLSGYDYVGDGRVGIAYDISYHMPYLMVGADLNITPSFSLTGSVSVAPYVKAKDKDQHLLREYGGKLTESDMDGTAFWTDVSGKYHFTPIWFVELGFHAAKIDVDGTMNQSYVWFGDFASNKVESESTQVSGYFNLGASF